MFLLTDSHCQQPDSQALEESKCTVLQLQTSFFVGISIALKRQGKALERGSITRIETNAKSKLLQFNF